MLKRLIFVIRVVRFSPSFAAAPRSPPMIHLHSSNVRKIKDRCDSLKLPGTGFVSG